MAVPAGLELELSKMTPEDRAEFEREMGLVGTDRDHLIRTLLKISGQMIFFTAGEKEVRTWLLRQGGTALEAADGIHTDLARGFIRAEVMTVSRFGAPGQRARTQGPAPDAAGAEGLRRQGRRHSVHPVQRLITPPLPLGEGQGVRAGSE